MAPRKRFFTAITRREQILHLYSEFVSHISGKTVLQLLAINKIIILILQMSAVIHLERHHK